MSNITAAMVKSVSDQTLAGLINCKAALDATSGDVEQAVDWLHEKGLSKIHRSGDSGTGKRK